MKEPTITTYRDKKEDCFVWEIRVSSWYLIEVRSWRWRLFWSFIRVAFRFLKKWEEPNEK